METLNSISSKIYLLVDYTNKNNFLMKDFSMEPYNSLLPFERKNIELIQSPDITEYEHRGSCYDQTFLVKKWLDELNIENRCFYSITRNVPRNENGIYFYNSSVISHTFILCKDEDVWKWPEWSWFGNIHNNFQDKDVNVVLKRYKNMAENHWHHPIYLREVPLDKIQLPMPRLKFMNICLSAPELEIFP